MPREEVFVTLTNEAAYVTDVSAETDKLLSDYWSFRIPGAFFAPAFRAGVWDGRIRFYKKGQLPAGLFRATYDDILQKHPVKFIVTKDRPAIPQLLPGLPPQTDPQYAYQNECVDAMCKALDRGGGLVVAATASGKTAITSHFFSRLPFPCIFIVDQLPLLDQAQKELSSWLGERVGTVGRSIFDPQRITVSTIQTLKQHENDRRFLTWYKSVKVVVVDESMNCLPIRTGRSLISSVLLPDMG